MKEKIRSWIRPSSKKTDIFILAALLSIVLLFIGDIVGELLDLVIPYGKIIALMSPNEEIAPFATIYTPFLGVWIVFFLFCIVKYNRPMIGKLTLNKRALKGALIGAVIGFSFNGICILGAALSGDIKLSLNEINPGLIIFFIIIVCIQSGAEEITERVYLYQKLRRRYKSPLVAILGNALIFAAFHAFNPGVTLFSLFSIFVVGLFYSVLVYYYDCVWVAIMVHTMWNFTQNILFGLPNSGIVSQYSVFKLDAASARDGFFYSVAFGVEGSYAAVLVDIIGIVAVIMLGRGKGEKCDMWAGDDKSPVNS